MDSFKFPLDEYRRIEEYNKIIASNHKLLLNKYFDNFFGKAEKNLALYKQYMKNWEGCFVSSIYLKGELDKLTAEIRKQLENYESCEIEKFAAENVTDDYIELCKDNIGNPCMGLVHSLFLSQENIVKNLNKLKKQEWFNPTVTYIWEWDCPNCGSLISYERKDRRIYSSNFKPVRCENCGFFTKEPSIIKPYDLDEIIPRLYSDFIKVKCEIPNNTSNDTWDLRSQYKAFELNKEFITSEIFDLVKYLINLPGYVGSEKEILEAITDKRLDYGLDHLEDIGVIKKYQVVKDNAQYSDELFNGIVLALGPVVSNGSSYSITLRDWLLKKEPSPNDEHQILNITSSFPEYFNIYYYINEYIYKQG